MIFFADLPKPLHGMSAVNASMLKLLQERSSEVHIINTVPSYAAKFFNTPFWAIVKIFHSFGCLIMLVARLAKSDDKILYRAVNGGWGQLFDIVYFGAARLLGAKIYVHHHCFQYVDRQSRLFESIVWIIGPDAVHLVLGQKMRNDLLARYAIPQDKVEILSNLAFFLSDAQSAISESTKTLTIGHLANLCVAKGSLVFLDVVAELASREVEFEAHLAGPFADRATELAVDNALKQFPQLIYHGPVYAAQKRKFYECLDLFLFNSEYINEAEPLVLYEAAQQGAYIIGSARGCMADMLASLGGTCVPSQSAGAQSICDSIEKLVRAREFSPIHRAKRRTTFAKLQREWQSKIVHVIDVLSGSSRTNSHQLQE